MVKMQSNRIFVFVVKDLTGKQAIEKISLSFRDQVHHKEIL